MSQQQLASFLESVAADPDLQARLRSLSDVNDAVQIANDAGFAITREEVTQYQQSHSKELSDEDLEAVTGGAGRWYNY